MKRILFLVAIAICAVSAASAQITVNESTVSAKVGIDKGYGIPVTLTYENALWGISSVSCVTLGGTVGFGVNDNVSHFLIGARGAYHYAINSWDLSGGMTLGANICSDSGFLWGFDFGTSYYFNENWAASAIVGYGVTNFGLGATYKF